MSRLREIEVHALEPARLEALIGPVRAAEFAAAAATTRAAMAGRRVVNVNSTASGGGVAELLQTLLAYARGVGVDARWVVIDGDPEFFRITKRIHNHLYGSPGDGGPLGPKEHDHYAATLRPNGQELLSILRSGDVVLLHDPQTAGLVDVVRDAGAQVVWRCHVGRDEPNEHTESGWAFLRPYLERVQAFVFTRAQFAPPWVDPASLHVITPSIDPFSPKNERLAPDAVLRILQYVGLLGGGDHDEPATYQREDGSPARVDRRADILQTGQPPAPDVPLVVQLSRWDRMKDMAGVLEAFVEHVDHGIGAHLALVGPSVRGVEDDPEGGAVLDDCMGAWRELPASARRRVHLACVPMADVGEAAVITNALQRHAAVVTQKSIAEGFGLTVVEAMWKHRPIVATRVGGITDQIVDGEHGLLVDDPHDLATFGAAVHRLLADRALAERLGENAFRRAHAEFLGDRHLERYANLLVGVMAG